MSPSKDDPASLADTPPSKVAMKGFTLSARPGAKSISFATKSRPLTTALGKRPRATLQHGSDDEDEEGTVRHEAVTGFDIKAGGAQTKVERAPKGPLVIPAIKTSGLRGEMMRATAARRGKNLLPPEVQAQRAGKGRTDEAVNTVNDQDSEPQWGLTITKKAAIENGGSSAQADFTPESQAAKSEYPIIEDAEPRREKTDDELAIEALTGAQTKKKGPELVIHAVGENGNEVYVPPPQLTEGDAYRRAIEAAPHPSTQEDYEDMPVEEFGAAYLRGLGWKEGDAKKGRVDRPKDVKRRQNLLGLGATELKGAEELGAWVQKSDPKRLGTGSRKGGGERRPKANEYREQKERKRDSRDERYGGSHRRDRERDDYRDRDRQRDRDQRY